MLFTTHLSTALYLDSLALYLSTSSLFSSCVCLQPRDTHRAAAYECDTSDLEPGHLATLSMVVILLLSFAAFLIVDGRAGAGKASEAPGLVVYLGWWVGVVLMAVAVMLMSGCLLLT